MTTETEVKMYTHTGVCVHVRTRGRWERLDTSKVNSQNEMFPQKVSEQKDALAY